MDFLRLSRSRSGSSGNKKRSPLPSPSGRRTSGGLDDVVLSSHASDHAAAQDEGTFQAASDATGNVKPGSTSQSTSVTQHQISSAPQTIGYTFPSLLSPPNPAFVSGSDARGILLNARRPSQSLDAGMVQTRSASSPFASVGSSSSSSKQLHQRDSLGSSPLVPRPPHLRSSVSSDSMLSSTKNAGNDTATPIDQRGRGRIRFAPLPDPRRPRSHSTGRDIWFDEDSENHIHINTRDGTEVVPSSWSSSGSGNGGLGSMNGTSAQSNSLSLSLGEDMSEEYSTSPNSRGPLHKRTSSTLSKLLQPLKLGRSRSRESDKPNSPDSDVNRLSLSVSPSTSLSQWMNGGEPLSRSISTGAGTADIERQRKEEFRSSGIPLKKSSTQESNKSYNKQQPARRILYPSVAQGGVRKRDIRRSAPVVEPDFVEWTNPSARSGMSTEEQDEDDDGSGMAWLKKRRAEREKKAKEEAEAAAAGIPGSIPKEADVVTHSEGSQITPLADVSVKTEQNNVPDIKIARSEDQAIVSTPDKLIHREKDGNAELKSPMDGTEGQEDVQEEDEDDDDSSSASEDEEQEDDNPDDLTAAEIEEEERLAEEARRTTGGASRELYHSHEHQSSTYTFEAPPLQRRPSSRSNSLNLPPTFERQLSYSSSSSLRPDLPKPVATSHPGDWPLREHVVPPC